MDTAALVQFISDYISSRRQLKLDAFEKEAIKRLEKGEEAAAIAEDRQSILSRYEPGNWLADAAKRAGQISLVSHAAKFTHSDSRSSSIYRDTPGEESYLSTASLTYLTTDAVGNAAALDVAKLLQTEVAGDSLLACLKRGEYQPLKVYAQSDTELAEWIEGFSQALAPSQSASHKLAKQIYFPVGEDYHLLCPLFATSLAQAMHEKLVAMRFSEEAKAIREARKQKRWHAKPDKRFPKLAEMRFGGTKPQNISALNSARGGRAWLLAAHAPLWQSINKPPLNMLSFFESRGAFHRQTHQQIWHLTSFLHKNADNNNLRIRDVRAEYIDELVDLMFNHAATFQQQEWQGWTQNASQLPRHQQLWLDPWRSKNDETFRHEREKEDWQKMVAGDFARWLNVRLNQKNLSVGRVERREWQTLDLLRQRMREMEAILQEALK